MYKMLTFWVAQLEKGLHWNAHAATCNLLWSLPEKQKFALAHAILLLADVPSQRPLLLHLIQWECKYEKGCIW